jgi:hypothetical protein
MSLISHYDLPKKKQKGCVTKGSDYDQRRSKRSDSVDAYIYIRHNIGESCGVI